MPNKLLYEIAAYATFGGPVAKTLLAIAAIVCVVIIGAGTKIFFF